MIEQSFTLLEARPLLGNLVVRAQGGESVVITRYGKPAARITPVGEQARTIELASGGTVTLSFTAKPLHLSQGDREWLFGLFDTIKKYEADNE